MSTSFFINDFTTRDGCNLESTGREIFISRIVHLKLEVRILGFVTRGYKKANLRRIDAGVWLINHHLPIFFDPPD